MSAVIKTISVDATVQGTLSEIKGALSEAAYKLQSSFRTNVAKGLRTVAEKIDIAKTGTQIANNALPNTVTTNALQATTRTANIVERMETNNNIEIERLTEDVAWAKLQKLGGRAVRKNSLPVAVVSHVVNFLPNTLPTSQETPQDNQPKPWLNLPKLPTITLPSLPSIPSIKLSKFFSRTSNANQNLSTNFSLPSLPLPTELPSMPSIPNSLQGHVETGLQKGLEFAVEQGINFGLDKIEDSSKKPLTEFLEELETQTKNFSKSHIGDDAVEAIDAMQTIAAHRTNKCRNRVSSCFHKVKDAIGSCLKWGSLNMINLCCKKPQYTVIEPQANQI